MPYSILSGTKQTDDGEKKWEKGKEKGQTSPWHLEAHDGGVGSRAGCASAAGFVPGPCHSALALRTSRLCLAAGHAVLKCLIIVFSPNDLCYAKGLE